jgi:pilus assembly protein TadC
MKYEEIKKLLPCGKNEEEDEKREKMFKRMD